MSAPRPHSHETASLGDEALALVAAAQAWLSRSLPVTGAELPTGAAAECAWCPVCQVIASLRADRPELARRLGETQNALAGLLRAAADLLGTPGQPAAPDPSPASGTTPAAAPGHAAAGQAAAGHAAAGHAAAGQAAAGQAAAEEHVIRQRRARRSRSVQHIVLDEEI